MKNMSINKTSIKAKMDWSKPELKDLKIRYTKFDNGDGTDGIATGAPTGLS